MRIALIIQAVYLVSVNAVLAAGNIEHVFSSGKAVKVHFRRAWSWWPGKVHADDLRVTMQDRNVQFVLDIPSVDVTVSLSDLTKRTFHATKVRGRGVVFRLRERIHPESVNEPFVTALPPIPGFPDPPLRDKGPRPKPIDDAHYKLWTVHIEDVDVGVREVWIDVFRYQGEARAVGAFRLKPARRVWVGPATLSIEKGFITTGPHGVMDRVEGHVRCLVEDFNVQAVHGAEVLRYISSGVRLAAHLSDLKGVSFLLAPKLGFSLDEGAGSFDADVTLDRGVFTPASRFEYRTRRIGAVVAGRALHLDGDLTIAAHGPASGLPGRLSLDVSQSTLEIGGSTHPPPRITDLAASLSLKTVDLTRHWALGESDLRIGEIKLPDLRWLNDIPTGLASTWSVEEGEGSASGAAVFSSDRGLRGWSVFRVAKATFRAGDLRLQATAEAETNFEVAANQFRQGDLRLEARDIGVGQVGSGVCPWTTIESASISGRIATAEGRPATRELRATFRRPAFHWGEFEAAADRASLDGQWNAGWMQARIESRGVRLRNAGGPPRSWQANVDQVSVDTVMTSAEGRSGGSVRVEARQASGQVGKTKMRGDLVAQLAMVSPDAPRTAEISGVILARNVALSKGEKRIDGWWAEIKLRHAALATTSNFDIAATGRARVQNGLPVLYLLSSEGESPSWLISQLARSTLTVDLDVNRFCRWTDVQIPLIEGGLLFAQGRVQAEPGQTYGAMLFRLAPIKLISVGVAFYEDYTDTSLLAGKGWLEEQVLPMSKAAATKREMGCPARAGPPRCE